MVTHRRDEVSAWTIGGKPTKHIGERLDSILLATIS